MILEEVDGHHDRRQNVVQVMRDAAGQRADAFHALRPHELGLDLFLFRDVGIDREHRFGLSFVVPDERPARLDGDFPPVLGEMLEFAVPFALTDRQGVDFFKLFRIGVEKLADIPADELPRASSRTCARLPCSKTGSCRRGRAPGSHPRLVQKGRLFRDLLLGPLPLGDVGSCANDIFYRPRRIEESGVGPRDQPRLPVFGEPKIFMGVRKLPGAKILEIHLGRCLLLRDDQQIDEILTFTSSNEKPVSCSHARLKRMILACRSKTTTSEPTVSTTAEMKSR